MGDILMDRWGSPTVLGDKEAEKPSLVAFNNTVDALTILKKHIDRNSRIAIHCDVDVDGIGTGYIAKAFLNSQGARNILTIINKEKVHGIEEKHVNYFNNINKCDLIIIVDSSTNEVETIKKFKCDVLVVDHHEINHNDTRGKTDDGEYEYVIVNNMIENKNVSLVNEWLIENNPTTAETLEEYTKDERMSCGLVLYELLRVYCEAYSKGPVLENLLLYQWVGVTLFSDVIQLTPDRNQWYIENTVHSMEVENNLRIMMLELNKYKHALDKSYIGYTFAPTINKAIRYGAGGEALDIVMNRPKDIRQLDKYKDRQAEVLEAVTGEDQGYSGDYIIKDVTDLNISRNFCGVVGSRLSGDNDANTVVYIRNGKYAEGSFRGRRSGVDYRGYFEGYDKTIFAQGHKAAFGFKVQIDMLEDLMGKLVTIEPKKTKFYLTAGVMRDEHKGKHHITDIDEFKRSGNFWRLATANSKLSSEEQLDIIVGTNEVKLVEQRGKLYLYDVMGMTCKAFQPITTELAIVYVEFSKEIEIYVKNLNI